MTEEIPAIKRDMAKTIIEAGIQRLVMYYLPDIVTAPQKPDGEPDVELQQAIDDQMKLVRAFVSYDTEFYKNF